MSHLASFETALRSAGFCGDVEHDRAGQVVYGTDNSVYQLEPTGVVVPRSVDDLVAIVQANHTLDRPFELVARGGGTGTNGQSLTNGIVVDTRRAMNSIVSIDVAARTAVVEPGVVLDQLNAELRPQGLFFAPHVSTATRATIGGMVSTDAAGKGSLVHGRTNDHVRSIDAVLADGTPWTFRPLDRAELDVLCSRTDRVGDLHRQLRLAVAGVDRSAFPDIPRGFTGYNLTGATTGHGDLDTTKLLAGAEGTLALIARIELELSPVADDPHLAVISYDSFEEAIRDSNRLKETKPTAIECLDERTISLATASPSFPRLAALLRDGGADLQRGSLLLMEFDGVAGVEQLRDVLAHVAGATALAVTSDPADIAAVWKVRADAVGLLGQAVSGRRSVAFVEDCAVPPHRLEAFVREFRDVLDHHGLSYGMFGHADVGCVHVRPALDLLDPDHERLLRTISDEVAALVGRFGGVLWGEHGRGFRGEYLDLDESIVQRMRLIKTAFDPGNVMNPGKLYTPVDVEAPIVRIDEVPLRVHRDRQVAAAQRAEFDSAFACNGNGICHHWGGAEVMCPSFKVTNDPRLSPKGRADMIRAWLQHPDDTELAADLADSMHQCLSCGACTGRCPVEVDIPELKSRFLECHGERSPRRRIRNAALSRFESMLPIAQRLGPAARPLQRAAAAALGRTLGIVDLPDLPSRSAARRLADLRVPTVDGKTGTGDATVVVLPDAFTSYIEPDVLAATIDVLRAVGERPAVASFVPSGKFDHVTGRRARFERAVRAQRRSVEALAGFGLPLVIVEPAVSLLGAHEYASMDPSFPHASTIGLAEYLAPRVASLPNRAIRGVAQLFEHCTEVSLTPERTDLYRTMLEAAGFEVQVESTTCCGMAGIFGHETEHQEMSAALFDLGWRPRLDSFGPVVRCASGFSCRSQAERFGHVLTHPVQVLADALR